MLATIAQHVADKTPAVSVVLLDGREPDADPVHCILSCIPSFVSTSWMPLVVWYHVAYRHFQLFACLPLYTLTKIINYSAIV